MDLVNFVSFLLGFSIFFSVILLIRKGRLKEKYSILWLIAGFFICIFSISRRFLEWISFSIGIYYPPTLLFLAGVLFLVVINISFSVTISELSTKIEVLAQRLALLEGKDR